MLLYLFFVNVISFLLIYFHLFLKSSFFLFLIFFSEIIIRLAIIILFPFDLMELQEMVFEFK